MNVRVVSLRLFCRKEVQVTMFNSYTYGQLNIEQIPDKLVEFYNSHKVFESDTNIVIGTDSQNFSDTKQVSVIAIICKGHGGIFFYEISRLPKIRDVRKKLHTETQSSLEIADKLVEILESDKRYEELYLNCNLSIHIDAGNSPTGRTRELIPELVGWVSSMGYDCRVKPLSFVASSIADKISK